MTAPNPVRELELRIEAATKFREEAHDAYGVAAYKHSIGECSEEELAKARGEYRFKADRVADLELALEGARKAEEERLREARKAAHQTTLRAVRQHLSRRDKAVAELADALAAAVKAWETALDASDKARALVPRAAFGSEQAASVGLLDESSLDRIIASELFRLSGPRANKLDPTSPQRFIFPGARPLSFTGWGLLDEKHCPPAVKQIADATAWIMRRIEIADPAALPPPVAPEPPKELPPVERPEPSVRPDPNAPRAVAAEPEPLKHAPITSPAGAAEFLAQVEPFVSAEEHAEIAATVIDADFGPVPVEDKAGWLAKQRAKIKGGK
ncbi:MAG TPA: hypothetical protein VMF32_25370 [Xanthobacteraceae bacterium]|nr:hypothetical protein [Xanthobacteraceae bacterium]